MTSRKKNDDNWSSKKKKMSITDYLIMFRLYLYLPPIFFLTLVQENL